MNRFREFFNLFALGVILIACSILLVGYAYIHIENKHYQMAHKNQMITLREVREFYNEMQTSIEEDYICNQ